MANSPDTVYVLVMEEPDAVDIVRVVTSLRAAKNWEAQNSKPNFFSGIYGYYPVKITYED